MTHFPSITSVERLAPLSGGIAKKLVVLLHGLGADGRDLIDLGRAWQENWAARNIYEDVAFIAPNAPLACDMAPVGFQWFSLQDWTIEAMQAGAAGAHPNLDAFLHAELQTSGLTPSDMVLVGFSQGTMMSLYTALRQTDPFAGVLGYSGALLDTVPSQLSAASKPTKLCLIHGEMDPVVPVQASVMAHQTLNTLGYDVTFYTIPNLPHSIDPQGLRLGAEFLETVL